MADTPHNKPHLEQDEQYPKQVYDPPPKGEVPHYVHYMDKAERGLRTVRLVVFAGMTAFVVLAIYGYYLIYQLTQDAAQMTVTMEKMSRTMEPMGQNMMVMTQSLVTMTDSVNRIQYSAGHMDRSFSTPMNAMNRFMPWGGERSYRPQTPFVPYSYTAPPATAYSGEAQQQQAQQ